MMLSPKLERTLHRSLSLAVDRKHAYATLEHLLLGLVDDQDAASVLQACDVDIDKVRRDLTEFLDKDLAELAEKSYKDSKPTAGFQRVVQRAAIHMQSAGHDEVTGANVLVSLFSERESHAVYFLQLQDMSRLDAVNFINYGIRKSRSHLAVPKPRPKTKRSLRTKPPPKLPAQGVGPHVEINAEGVISFPPAESIDREGNHLPTLRSFHPEIIELARELCAGLKEGNAPHSVLAEIVTAYANLIDQQLNVIDFRRLYAIGIRLSNAAFATNQSILSGDLPPLKAPELEKLQSLLVLHGPFILASAAGAEAVEYELRYQRRPSEEKEYREAAISIAKSLQGRNDLIKSGVAEQIMAAVRDIGTGYNPERSTVAGGAMVRNLMIVIAGGAIAGVGLWYGGAVTFAHFIGQIAISETIKKTSWFKTFTQNIASEVDEAMDTRSKEAADLFRSGLRRQSKFVMEHEEGLRILASNRKELTFVIRALDWLKQARE